MFEIYFSFSGIIRPPSIQWRIHSPLGPAPGMSVPTVMIYPRSVVQYYLSIYNTVTDAPMVKSLSWTEEERVIAHIKVLLDNGVFGHVIDRLRIFAQEISEYASVDDKV